jgi:hypothetical protein
MNKNSIFYDVCYVLINTKDEGLNKNVLPSIIFNHVIAAVETRKGLRYLDFTANNYPMGSIPEYCMDAFSLLVKTGVQEPKYLPRDLFIANNITRHTSMTVHEDNRLFIELNSKRTGTLGALIRYYYRNKGREEVENELTASMNINLPNVKLTKFEFKNLDNLEETVESIYACEVPNYITETGQFKFLKIPWSDKLVANDALSYDLRKYPYYYWPWIDTTYEEIELKMPESYKPVDLTPEVKLTSSIADFTVSYVVYKDGIKATREMIYKKTIIETSEYMEFKIFYNAVLKEDNKQLLFRKTGMYKQ